VELGEGIQAFCRLTNDAPEKAEKAPDAKAADLSSLTSMLQSKWKGGQGGGSATPRREPARAGQIRSFKIVKLDAAAKRIDVEMV
jgi:small subunit ribosomal protein S1